MITLKCSTCKFHKDQHCAKFNSKYYDQKVDRNNSCGKWLPRLGHSVSNTKKTRSKNGKIK